MPSNLDERRMNPIKFSELPTTSQNNLRRRIRNNANRTIRIRFSNFSNEFSIDMNLNSVLNNNAALGRLFNNSERRNSNAFARLVNLGVLNYKPARGTTSLL